MFPNFEWSGYKVVIAKKIDIKQTKTLGCSSQTSTLHYITLTQLSPYLHKDLADAKRYEHQFLIRCFDIIAFHCYVFSSGKRRCMEMKNAYHRCSGQPETRSPCDS